MMADVLFSSFFLINTACVFLFGSAAGVVGGFFTIKNNAATIQIAALSFFCGTLACPLLQIEQNILYEALIAFIMFAFAFFMIKSAEYSLIFSKKTLRFIIMGIYSALALFLFSYMLNNAFQIRFAENLLIGSTINLSAVNLIILASVSVFVLLVILLLFKKFETAYLDSSISATLSPYRRNYFYLMIVLCLLLVFAGTRVTGIFVIVPIFITPFTVMVTFKFGLRKTLLLSALTGGVAAAIGNGIAINFNFPGTGVVIVVATICINIIVYSIKICRSKKSCKNEATQ